MCVYEIGNFSLEYGFMALPNNIMLQTLAYLEWCKYIYGYNYDNTTALDYGSKSVLSDLGRVSFQNCKIRTTL